MALITLQSVDYGVGGPLLLDGVDLAIEPGERIGIRIDASKAALFNAADGMAIGYA